MARAWKNGKPLGFGSDGTVEIERIHIGNPPILIDDVNGNINQESVDRISKELKIRKLREDPIEAVKQSLVRAIRVLGKENTPIIKGKFGNTAYQFYSVALGDGYCYHDDPTFATSRGGAGEGIDRTTANTNICFEYYQTVGGYWTQRDFFTFLSGTTINGGTVNTGTFSIKGTAGTSNPDSRSVCVTESTQADPTSLVIGDFDAITLNSPTELITRKTFASWSTTAFNDMTLNASGIAAINTVSGGYTKFCVRYDSDIDNVSITPIDQRYNAVNGYSADQAGTSEDPTITGDYSAAGGIPNKIYQLNQAVNRSNTY